MKYQFRASILAGEELLFNIRLVRSGRISQLVATQKLRIETAMTAVFNEFHARRARARMAHSSRARMSAVFGTAFGATFLAQLTCLSANTLLRNQSNLKNRSFFFFIIF